MTQDTDREELREAIDTLVSNASIYGEEQHRTQAQKRHVLRLIGSYSASQRKAAEIEGRIAALQQVLEWDADMSADMPMSRSAGFTAKHLASEMVELQAKKEAL